MFDHLTRQRRYYAPNMLGNVLCPFMCRPAGGVQADSCGPATHSKAAMLSVLCAAGQACCRPLPCRTRRGCTPERRCQAALCHAAGGVQSMLAKEGVLWSKGVLSAPRVSAPACAIEQALYAAACTSASGNGLIRFVTQKFF